VVGAGSVFRAGHGTGRGGQGLYPGHACCRWDRDTQAADHERFLQAFTEHRADVLIGTQMIAKGLDLLLVTLVGVISADTALHLPDCRAAERTFNS
jgi:primosomal protein N' (replication factor Y)